jgi:hypothetical protein
MKNERIIVWASVSLVSALFFIIIVSLFILPIVTAQKKQDILLLRADSEQISGRLNSLDSTLIQFNKTPFERSKVDIIRFSGATNTAPRANIQDQVLMRDGRLLLGYVSKINNRIVVQKGKQLNRSQVALIKLATENDSSDKDRETKIDLHWAILSEEQQKTRLYPAEACRLGRMITQAVNIEGQSI